MKRLKWVHLVLVLALMTSLLVVTSMASDRTQTAELTYRDIKITLDGQPLTPKAADGSEVEPFIIGGTTFLPVRGISSALGLEVSWDGATSTVILKTPENRKPVYITATGKRWHYDPHCNGGTYWEVPYSSAVGMGLTPCDKCVLKN